MKFHLIVRMVPVVIAMAFLTAGCLPILIRSPVSCLDDNWPPAVLKQCGCNPVTIQLDHALKATALTDQAKKEALSCANVAASAEVKGDNYKATFGGCLETKVTLDEEMRTKLIAMIDQYLEGASPEVRQHWNQCYADVIRPQPVSVHISRMADFRGTECSAGKRAYKNNIIDTLTFSDAIDEYVLQALPDQAGGSQRIKIFKTVDGKDIEVIPEEAPVGPSTTLTKKSARIRVDGKQAIVHYVIFQEPSADDNRWGLSFISSRPISEIDATVVLPEGKHIHVPDDSRKVFQGCTITEQPFRLTCNTSGFHIEPDNTKTLLWEWDVFEGC